MLQHTSHHCLPTLSPAAAGASRLLRALSLSIALLLPLLLIQLLACSERPTPLLLLPVLKRAMLLLCADPAADALSAGCIACCATIRANLHVSQKTTGGRVHSTAQHGTGVYLALVSSILNLSHRFAFVISDKSDALLSTTSTTCAPTLLPSKGTAPRMPRSSPLNGSS